MAQLIAPPTWRHAVALAGAGVAGAVLVGAIGLPDLAQPIADVSQTLGAWTYPVVGGLAFFETAAFVGLVVPGETAVVAAGVAAERGEVGLVPVLVVVWLAAAGGDTASFLLGRNLGRPFLEAHGGRLRLDAGRLASVQRFFEHHGGKAVIAGRFVGFARAVTPFLSGSSGFPMRRFIACSLAGALAWAALFTLVGYAFSGSIAEAGGAATRSGLGAVLILTLLFVVRSRIRSGRLRRARQLGEPQSAQATCDARRAAEDGAGDDVVRGVHARIHARASERERQPAAPEIRAQRQGNQQRALDPPSRQDDEGRRQHGMLAAQALVDGFAVEVEQPQEGRVSNAARAFLVIVNGQASGATLGGPQLLDEVTAGLAERGLPVDAVVTHSEGELCAALADAHDRRVVLVGGDGSLHAAANAPLRELPELALVPAGRANNIARALGIPTDPARAAALAATAPARGLDALRVVTPERSLLALEALSAGFQPEARARYAADNSSDLRQGMSALAHAARGYAPYRIELRLDGREIKMEGVAQLFLSNLPYFGFGFEVAPGTDPTDGCFEAILIEAGGRRELLLQLAAAYRGRHIERSGVQRITARQAELTAELPLVADSVPLGTTTATVTLERARVRLAVPVAGLRA